VAVYDEISGNSYQFNNVFNNQFNFKTYISNIFTDQKEACVYNTYLESKFTVDQYLANKMNVIEMENGPFLKSLTEKFLLQGAPTANNSNYDLSQIPMEVGIINYASDNPLVQNLTQESTSLQGVEPVLPGFFGSTSEDCRSGNLKAFVVGNTFRFLPLFVRSVPDWLVQY
jgi:hypothetical protein